MTSNDESPVSHLRALTDTDIPDDYRAEYQQFLQAQQEARGFVPNLFKVLPLNPHQFKGWLAFVSTLASNPDTSYLEPIDQELLGIVVSSVNQCHLCLAVHSDVLRGLTGDPEWVELVTYNFRSAKLSDRQRALADFAYYVTKHPNEVEGKHIEALRGVGLDEHEVLEAVLLASYFNFSNRLSTSLGIKVNSEHFTNNR